jgi:hypothetical protein
MSKEIRIKMNQLSEEAERLMDPTTFVLNPRIVAINKEIEELQSKCQHHFVEGMCEFCDLEAINE